MLDESIKEQLKLYFEKIEEDIILEATLGEDEFSNDMKTFLESIESLSVKLSLDLNGSSSYCPSFLVKNSKKDIKIEFCAIPLGHELTSFVLAVLQASGYAPKITESQINTIKNVSEKFDFTSYISLSCQNCPDIVQAINTMAVLSPNITSRVVDGAIFTEEVEGLKIKGIPCVYLNGKELYQGRMTLDEILLKMGATNSNEVLEKLNSRPTYDVLVVGAGPSGCSAAIYSARKGLKTAIVADKFGGQVSETMDIENFISVPKTQGPKLVSNLMVHVRDYDIDVIDGQRVKKIEDNKGLFTLTLDSEATLKTNSLIIATGARWRHLGVKGESDYLKKGVAFCPHCDGPLYKGKKVAVIGGGNSGVEAGIDLAGIAKEVVLIEFAKELNADIVLQKKLKSLSNVKVITNSAVQEVVGNGDNVTGIIYVNRDTEELVEEKLDGIFVQIGLMPNAEWAKGFIELNRHGEIIIDNKCQTSKEGVFASGDVTDVPYKQIIIASGEGAKASLSAFNYLIRKNISELVVQ